MIDAHPVESVANPSFEQIRDEHGKELYADLVVVAGRAGRLSDADLADLLLRAAGFLRTFGGAGEY